MLNDKLVSLVGSVILYHISKYRQNGIVFMISYCIASYLGVTSVFTHGVSFLIRRGGWGARNGNPR